MDEKKLLEIYEEILDGLLDLYDLACKERLPEKREIVGEIIYNATVGMQEYMKIRKENQDKLDNAINEVQ